MSVTLARFTTACCWLCWFVVQVDSARSETAMFEIQSASSLRIVPTEFDPNTDEVVGGTYFLDTYGIYEQKQGSLESKITGTLVADVVGSSISFGQTSIDAPLHPGEPFLPHPPGSPGMEDNFGAYVETAGFRPFGEMAVRDATAVLIGGSTSVGGTVGSLQFYLSAGILDYRLNFPPLHSYYELANSDTVPNESPGQLTGDLNGTIHIPFYLEFPYAVADPEIIDSLLILEGEIVATRVPAEVLGDYNGNQVVDAADYVVWRDTLNSSTDLRADGDNSGAIGPGDYTVWRTNFGRTPGLGSGGDSPIAVPEPSCLTLAMMTFVAFVACLHQRRKH